MKKLVFRCLISVLFLGIYSSTLYAEKIATGAVLVRLTHDGKTEAIACAPRGNKIVYKRRHTNTQRQLFIADSDGNNEEAVSPIGNPYYVQWSWGGDKIAYLFSNSENPESQGNAFIYDVQTKKTITITPPYIRDNLDEDEGPLWSLDDKYVVFKTRRGPSRTRYVTVVDVEQNKTWDIFSERGQNRMANWALSEPHRLTFLTMSGEDSYDLAVTDVLGRDLKLLTNNGAETISNWESQWRPPGPYPEMITFTSNKEMTHTERGLERNDVWIASPDGSFVRNLTQATSPSTEHQLNNDVLRWSWDGRWILSRGDRFDNQGQDIHTVYLIDPENGGYEIIFTTHPKVDSVYERGRVIRWSYDSKYILLYTTRYDVKNWNTDREYQQTRHVLSLIDVKTRQRDEILFIDEDIDRKQLLGRSSRRTTGDITFSPDGRSVLLSIAEIVSEEEEIDKPDLYRLELPKRYWNSQLAAFPGPPVGRRHEQLTASLPLDQKASEQQIPQIDAPSDKSLSVNPSEAANSNGIVTEVIQPENMTVDEAIESLSTEYSQYFTKNVSRNLLLFKGPADLLAELKSDLSRIDSKPPQILVDLLAVELSDEANRELGLDWTYAEGHFAFFQPAGKAIRDITPYSSLGGLTTYPGAGQMFYQGVGTLPSEFFVRLNTLISDGQGTILANPRTVATSGHESTIQIRRVVNFFFNEGFDTAGRPIVKKSDISADTVGRITPILLPGGKIHLEVDVGVGSFTFTEVSGLPEQTQRQSKTEVTVEQGQTIVIGGLRQQEMSTKIVKVPLLGELPLLGFLFKNEKAEVKNSVLTIFITPQILQNGEQTPEWPQLDPEDHKIVPIMKDSYPGLKDFFDNEKNIKIDGE